MISASKEFKEKLKIGANVVNYADVTLSNGTILHLGPKDFMIGGCQIEDKTTDGKFGVGFVIGKTLSIRIANHDERFSQYDFYLSIITLYVGLELDDGSIEKIRKGVYYATVPETPGDIIEISAVDGMYRLDRDYAGSSTVYPSTLQTILTDACLDCGIPIGFRQFDNMNFVVKEKPENATYRQVVSWAAQIAGYNARIDNDGYMQLIWYKTSLLEGYNYVGGNFKVYPHDTVIDGGGFKDYSKGLIISGGNFTDEQPEHIFRIKTLDVHTDDVRITGVRVTGEDDAAALFGEEGYVIEVKGNPFSYGKEQEVANYLGNRMAGITFRPFTAQVLNNPLYEPFEIVKVSDRKGNVYFSIVNSISYTIGAYTQIACEAEDPIRNGSTYFSESAAAVVEARRNAEKQLTDYDKAVQNMNQLVLNSMGIFSQEEWQSDGSAIHYQSNKPITVDEDGKCHFEHGSTVWMMSDNGFFISNDGGKPGTFESGWDKNGNVTTNILYAIGVVADWIRSGRFECRKGETVTFVADVDTGEVRIVADSFSLTSGDTIESIAQDKADDALDSAKTYADGAAKGAVNAQTQADIFNKLTNNGEAKGIYLKNKQLYISFTYAQGGTLALGGSNNGNGVMSIRNASGAQVGYIDNTGVHFSSGSISLGNLFSVDSAGNLVANSLSSTNANITGGSINIEANSLDISSIILRHGYNSIELGPYGMNRRDTQYGGFSHIGSDSIYVSKDGSIASMNAYGGSIGTYVSADVLSASRSIISSGTKSRIIKTPDFGTVTQYCYETPSPLFGDIGEGQTDETGVCYIYFDSVFLETVSTDRKYHVFLQKEGSGDLWVEEKEHEYFLVKGSPNLKFSWEMKVRQKDYEYNRLDVFDDKKNHEENIDYENQAFLYLENYEKELFEYEETY